MGKRTILALLAAVATTGAGYAAVTATQAGGFDFTPVPRWTKDPDTNEVCAAIKRECPALWKGGEVEASVGYDELYDPRGMLVGLRLTNSTGCKPLDESALLSQRDFKLTFHKDDEPDLTGVHVELAPGIDAKGVRMVKAGGTSISMGCN